MTKKADPARLAEVVAVLERIPGASAYRVSLELSPGPVPPHLVMDPLVADPPAHATTAEVVVLLAALERAGRARQVPDPKGAHWYPRESSAGRE
jgi:hypothetical protein